MSSTASPAVRAVITARHFSKAEIARVFFALIELLEPEPQKNPIGVLVI